MSGQVDSSTSITNFRCTFPPNVFPELSGDDFGVPFGNCRQGTVSNVVTVPGESSTDDVSRILKSESSTLMPLGKVEIAAGVIVSPQFKVRVSGGLNYPGVHNVSVTGVYFFSAN
jgi:hypothetical protein